jgi:hypothetical protein
MLLLLKAFTIAISLVGSIVLFRFFPAWMDRLGSVMQRLARHTRASFVCFLLAPILIRLLLLPWFPPPIPQIHDEFSHLLVAETLNSGRLTNPPHPFWRHFETIYVLAVPTNTSKYPPGIGAAMALGLRLAGHPWAGTLLVSGLFCAFAYWMLLGWIPPAWALAGGILATINFGPLHPWNESYLGGGVAALGGSIVFGAIPRLYRNPSPFYPAILVAGWGLVWFTRPYEAAICAALLTPVILYPFRHRPLRSIAAALVPAITVGFAIAAFFFYYNYRVTGSAWIMPYKLYQNQYGVPQNFLWQKMVTGPVSEKKNIADVFEWQKKKYIETRQPASFVRTSLRYLNTLWVFYAGYVGRGLPFLLLFWPPLWRSNRRIPLLLGLLSTTILASLLYPFRQPHYLAHFTSLFLLLTLLALQYIFSWRWKSFPAGPVLVITVLATSWFHKLRAPEPLESTWHITRSSIQSRLEQSGEKHLIFVHYAPTHNFFHEWVYNGADIDRSSVVWAQPLDPASDAALIRHFAGRKVWVLQPDAPNRPFFPLAAGNGDAPRDGAAPQ